MKNKIPLLNPSVINDLCCFLFNSNDGYFVNTYPHHVEVISGGQKGDGGVLSI